MRKRRRESRIEVFHTQLGRAEEAWRRILKSGMVTVRSVRNLQLVIVTCLWGCLYSPCAAQVQDSLKCSALQFYIRDRSCWKELTLSPKCYVWGRYSKGIWEDRETLSWTGECAGELAQGNGTLMAITMFGREVQRMAATGLLEDGKKRGRWKAIWPAGRTRVGNYVNGERHGKFVTLWDGHRNEQTFVNGVEHGYWFTRFSTGEFREGSYVKGRFHGRFTVRTPDGALTTKMYDHGKDVTE